MSDWMNGSRKGWSRCRTALLLNTPGWGDSILPFPLPVRLHSPEPCWVPWISKSFVCRVVPTKWHNLTPMHHLGRRHGGAPCSPCASTTLPGSLLPDPAMGLYVLLAGPLAVCLWQAHFSDVVFCSVQGPLSGSATLPYPGSPVPEHAIHSLKTFRKYPGFSVGLNPLFKKSGTYCACSQWIFDQ